MTEPIPVTLPDEFYEALESFNNEKDSNSIEGGTDIYKKNIVSEEDVQTITPTYNAKFKSQYISLGRELFTGGSDIFFKKYLEFLKRQDYRKGAKRDNYLVDFNKSMDIFNKSLANLNNNLKNKPLETKENNSLLDTLIDFMPLGRRNRYKRPRPRRPRTKIAKGGKFSRLGRGLIRGLGAGLLTGYLYNNGREISDAIGLTPYIKNLSDYTGLTNLYNQYNERDKELDGARKRLLDTTTEQSKIFGIGLVDFNENIMSWSSYLGPFGLAIGAASKQMSDCAIGMLEIWDTTQQTEHSKKMLEISQQHKVNDRKRLEKDVNEYANDPELKGKLISKNNEKYKDLFTNLETKQYDLSTTKGFQEYQNAISIINKAKTDNNKIINDFILAKEKAEIKELHTDYMKNIDDIDNDYTLDIAEKNKAKELELANYNNMVNTRLERIKVLKDGLKQKYIKENDFQEYRYDNKTETHVKLDNYSKLKANNISKLNPFEIISKSFKKENKEVIPQAEKVNTIEIIDNYLSKIKTDENTSVEIFNKMLSELIKLNKASNTDKGTTIINNTSITSNGKKTSSNYSVDHRRNYTN